MPVYDFRNKTSGEIFERSLRVSEYDRFLEENPEIERVHLTAPNLTNTLGNPDLKKPSGAFKEVLQKIHKETPKSNLANQLEF
jgi:hypothetical protein